MNTKELEIQDILNIFDYDIEQEYNDLRYSQYMRVYDEIQDNHYDDFVYNPDYYIDVLTDKEFLYINSLNLTLKGQAYLFSDMFYLINARFLDILIKFKI